MSRPGSIKTPRRALLDLIWRQPLWAIPFAIFFGTQLGARWHDYVRCYEVALTFAYSVGLSIWLARYVALRDVHGSPDDDRLSVIWRVGLTYVGLAVLGSYVAAIVVHFTMVPGFIGSPQAIVVSGMYTLLFASLFTGINFAMSFYHHALERARSLESVRAQLAEAELRALRAQIQPHFLFNTLNSIAALIHEDPAAAEDTITRLAEVFRYALRASDREHARLGDELEFVRSYLEIERTRLGTRLTLEEHIGPGLESARVPSLLLQPLVENAVRYAVAPRPEGGTVRLIARRDGARLVIEVEDDGPGFPAATSSANGFGLRSVRERLAIAGRPHALELLAHPGGGALARMTLPFEELSSTPPHHSTGEPS